MTDQRKTQTEVMIEDFVHHILKSWEYHPRDLATPYFHPVTMAYHITEIEETPNPFTPDHDETLCMERLFRRMIGEKLAQYGYAGGALLSAAYTVASQLVKYARENPRK